MDSVWKKKSPDSTRNEAQAWGQESRAKDGSEDGSSAVSRGVLEPGRGPSEQEEAVQDNEESDPAFDGAVAVEEERGRKQSSYSFGRKLSFQQQAYLHLQRMQDKHNEATMAFFETGKLDGTKKAYSAMLYFAQRCINNVTQDLQQAKQKEPAEQEAAFEAILKDVEDRSSDLCSHLDSAIEDAVATYRLNQIGMYNELIAIEAAKQEALLEKESH